MSPVTRMHPVEKGLYAALMPEMEIVGPVKKIGRNGLVFTYYTSGPRDIETALVDIFSESGTLYLSNIPCRISIKSGYKKKTFHQCRVNYGNTLSDSQREELNRIIEQYAESV